MALVDKNKMIRVSNSHSDFLRTHCMNLNYALNNEVGVPVFLLQEKKTTRFYTYGFLFFLLFKAQ
jgi:rRNA-processing protein FCF1